LCSFCFFVSRLLSLLLSREIQGFRSYGRCVQGFSGGDAHHQTAACSPCNSPRPLFFTFHHRICLPSLVQAYRFLLSPTVVGRLSRTTALPIVAGNNSLERKRLLKTDLDISPTRFFLVLSRGRKGDHLCRNFFSVCSFSFGRRRSYALSGLETEHCKLEILSLVVKMQNQRASLAANANGYGLSHEKIQLSLVCAVFLFFGVFSPGEIDSFARRPKFRAPLYLICTLPPSIPLFFLPCRSVKRFFAQIFVFLSRICVFLLFLVEECFETRTSAVGRFYGNNSDRLST
jgi:hypothetical protein